MARDSLAEQVQLKEAEIRSTYLRLREQERMIAINEERQRLVPTCTTESAAIWSRWPS